MPPAGFDGVLTQEQWKGVVDFARATDAKIVTSFATSPGVRDRSGVLAPQSITFIEIPEAGNEACKQ